MLYSYIFNEKVAHANIIGEEAYIIIYWFQQLMINLGLTKKSNFGYEI